MKSKYLTIDGKEFESRLLVGTGKYKNAEEAKQSITSSECSIVTVAVRRAKDAVSSPVTNLVGNLDWSKLWMLANTAGCRTVQEAIRVAELGREMAKQIGQQDNQFIKLEVIPDSENLLPDPIGTLKAAEYLVEQGFTVLPYINADPMLAKQLEDIGCATVMPLGSPIGSGQGLQNLENIKIIVRNSRIPVIVDAGIRSPSEASQAMELGVDGVLINTAIAKSNSSVAIAEAMKLSVKAGRQAYLSGMIDKHTHAEASSPSVGGITRA
uniref:Thiazole synthase n=1 Tax=Gronococcus sybilensis TaxID=3028029 RepID=A0A9Y1I2H4_9RHOD|nr:thiamin biosynthesis protein G [Gronococcus sybilensis]